MRNSANGFTLLEALFALAILAIALLALASGLGNVTLGVRQDGQRTAANQVATSVIESLRDQLRTNPSAFDGGSSETPPPMSIGGQTFEYSYVVAPAAVVAAVTPPDKNGDGNPEASVQTLFEVTVDVTTPQDLTFTYKTRIVRPIPDWEEMQ